MEKWRVDYDNDNGPGDGAFWEWWEVTDGVRVFKCDEEGHANWLCDTLNKLGRDDGTT